MGDSDYADTTAYDPNAPTSVSRSTNGRDYKSGARAAGSSLSAAGRDMMDDARSETQSRIGPVSYHRGGKVRKTGPARLKKGERVISKGKRKKVDRLMKRAGMRMKGGRR